MLPKVILLFKKCRNPNGPGSLIRLPTELLFHFTYAEVIFSCFSCESVSYCIWANPLFEPFLWGNFSFSSFFFFSREQKYEHKLIHTCIQYMCSIVPITLLWAVLQLLVLPLHSKGLKMGRI